MPSDLPEGLPDYVVAMERARILRRETDWPWVHITEDREKVHDVLTGLYAKQGLPRPRFTWARSPAAMFGAISLLREMQTTMRQTVIKQMTVGLDPMVAEVRAVFLESVMDKDLTVSMGANLRDAILPLDRDQRFLAPIAELAGRLSQKFTPQPNGRPMPAGWNEWVAYPMERRFCYDLLSQTLCFCAFSRAVWLCRPPVFIKTDEEGHLHAETGPAVRFEDGFEVFVTYRKPTELAHVKKSPFKRPSGPSAMEMLREAAAEKSMRGLPAPKEDSDASK
jgi:hypothetical protein